jgi:2-polyprenyl-3-methyl-5-hydroxy-6-metoxy-1,4-benzoquinol methylase
MTAKDHYSNHLAHFYSWMIGDFDKAQAAQQEYFIANNIVPGTNKVAIDLGAGHGLQSISLAKQGFKVIAVDFNRQLLDELADRKNDLPITPVLNDITEFIISSDEAAALIVCMGDTLTH